MPEDGIDHENYLSSHFFTEKSNGLNARARSRKKIKNTTEKIIDKSIS